MIARTSGIVTLLVLYGLVPAGGPAAAAARPLSSWSVPAAPGVCAGPEMVELRPTQNAPGGRGRMSLTQPGTPFGIAVDSEGRQRYEVAVEITQLRRREGATYIVWAATPELDEVVRLGLLGDDGRIAGEVAWNKFLVFVSEEDEPGTATWAGPILLTGLSPSGRMHTMAGHGPFEDVSCASYY